MDGKRSASRIFAAGDRRETGLKLVPWSMGLPGFRRGMILATFQMLGMMEVKIHLLKMMVMNLMPFGPKFLSIMGDMPSGPAALEFLAFLMAAAV